MYTIYVNFDNIMCKRKKAIRGDLLKEDNEYQQCKDSLSNAEEGTQILKRIHIHISESSIQGFVSEKLQTL